MFSPENAKTKALRPLARGGQVYSLDLPAGYTCPGAKVCKSRAVPQPGGSRKILDGPQCQFRCFAASAEALRTAVWNKRQRNLAAIRGCRTPHQVCRLLLSHLPGDARIVRLHVSGDFFNRRYLEGVMMAAKRTTHIRWYAYTKSLHLFEGVPMQDPKNGVVFDNFFLTASRGGRYDHLIEGLGLRTAEVVFSETEAQQRGLQIDHTDEHAAQPGGSFALLIHGVQPRGSEAAKAWRKVMANGGGYRR